MLINRVLAASVFVSSGLILGGCCNCASCPGRQQSGATLAAPAAMGAPAGATAAAPAPAPGAQGTAQPAAQSMGQAGVSTRVYKIPAKQMVQLVVDALSADPLNVKTTIDPNGVIRTDWKEGYQGEYHIARYWQERSRFIATVVPDWQDPVGACRVDVVDDTEARSNPRAAWGEKTGLRRPERCKALIDAIDAKAAAVK